MNKKEEKIAEKITNALDRMGIEYWWEESRLSSSQYIEIKVQDESGDTIDSKKIRISNHENNSCEADFEITTDFDGQRGWSNWLIAVIYAGEFTGKNLPSYIKRLITISRKKDDTISLYLQ